MDKLCMSCIDCGVTSCKHETGEPVYPDFCLTAQLDEDTLREALACYDEPENHRCTVASAVSECKNYCRHTRVQEIMDFANEMGIKKLGIATCVGLIREARILAKILRANHFEVCGVACKVGSVSKTAVGIPQFCEDFSRPMCNPILQAKLLNAAKTELNIVVGLCVGHDSLFYKYSDALVTTAVTKDRVTGHNPVSALYTAESYYKNKLFPEE